jgi:hypothetical protein
MKLKALVAAVAMAAGVAHATMPAQIDTTQGSALTFSLWNSTNGVSSLFDLGLSSTQFSYANVGGVACTVDCVVDKQITWNFGTGSVLSTGAADLSSLVSGVSGSWADTWTAYKPNVAGSVYDVFAADRDGATAVTQHILTSVASGTVSGNNTSLLSANGSNIGLYLANNGAQGNHASVANGADMVDSSSNAYQGMTGNFLTNWNGKLTNFVAAGSTSALLDFYSIDGVAGSSTAQFAKQNFNGKFALDEAAGTLTWTTYAVAAVPEPSTYAMLFAGLGLMGFMARRRAK